VGYGRLIDMKISRLTKIDQILVKNVLEEIDI